MPITAEHLIRRIKEGERLTKEEKDAIHSIGKIYTSGIKGGYRDKEIEVKSRKQAHELLRLIRIGLYGYSLKSE